MNFSMLWKLTSWNWKILEPNLPPLFSKNIWLVRILQIPESIPVRLKNPRDPGKQFFYFFTTFCNLYSHFRFLNTFLKFKKSSPKRQTYDLTSFWKFLASRTAFFLAKTIWQMSARIYLVTVLLIKNIYFFFVKS